MFGDGTPDRWPALLPAYGPSRGMLDGGFSSSFHASGDLLLGAVWVLGLTLGVALLLHRALSSRL